MTDKRTQPKKDKGNIKTAKNSPLVATKLKTNTIIHGHGHWTKSPNVRMR